MGASAKGLGREPMKSLWVEPAQKQYMHGDALQGDSLESKLLVVSRVYKIFLLESLYELQSISPTEFKGHGFHIRDYTRDCKKITRGTPMFTVESPLMRPRLTIAHVVYNYIPFIIPIYHIIDSLIGY